MIVGKYIRKLLNDRQRVVLPGFGNLEVKGNSGEVSKSGGKINPPGLTVRFDKGFSKDDGVLAAAVASGEGMQEEEARQRVLEMIDAIKFSLDKGESYALLETGTLWKDDDGKVHFQAVSDWVLEPEQYGLDSLDLLELEELTVEEEKADDIQLDIPAPPVKKKVARVSGRMPQRQVEEKKSRHINRWKAIWMIAGVLIVILLVLIFIPSDRKSLPVDVPPRIDKQPQEQVNSETSVPVPEQAVIESEPAVPEQVEEVLNFHIIAGSFKHLGNASDKQDKLKAKGFQAEMMITENRMYRVSVGSYATEAEALRALTELKSEPGLESCWLLSR
ncbi:MAG: SPOR domain-containing protein [Bacteroidota bacterium]